MKKKSSIFLATLVIILFSDCSKTNEVPDTEYPEIDTSIQGAFPQQCSVIKRGESFTFKARFSDNRALGSYSIDIHHNFDHHSHSTEVSDCEMEIVKPARNPFLHIQTFGIDGNPRQVDASTVISVPPDVDPGDYHFLIRLTDREGWQTIKGISIRVL